METDIIETDFIKVLVVKMEQFANKDDFESANSILKKIEYYLVSKDIDYSEEWKELYDPNLADLQGMRNFIENRISETSEYRGILTIRSIHKMLVSDRIRLNIEQIGISKWLLLLLSLHVRLAELQGRTYKDNDKRRKIVAEEMLIIGISIPHKKRGMGKMPNRRFLEIAYTVHPDISKTELVRREQIKLYKAIGSGNNNDLNKARKGIKYYKTR